MKCQRSGYCCIQYDVAIVVDPELGIREDNIRMKLTGERCMHLRGDKPGEHSCAVHHYPWYEETPCYRHSQIEQRDTPCRLGSYIVKKYNTGHENQS